MAGKIKILFLCTGNFCRSQMAEGWARHLYAETMDAYSAGTLPHGLDPLAVMVMAEAGVDISKQRSKHVDEFKDTVFDLVATLCDNARESCPVFLGGAKVVHHGFDDPPYLAMKVSGMEGKLAIYRRVRDEIRDFVAALPSNINP